MSKQRQRQERAIIIREFFFFLHPSLFPHVIAQRHELCLELQITTRSKNLLGEKHLKRRILIQWIPIIDSLTSTCISLIGNKFLSNNKIHILPPLGGSKIVWFFRRKNLGLKQTCYQSTKHCLRTFVSPSTNKWWDASPFSEEKVAGTLFLVISYHAKSLLKNAWRIRGANQADLEWSRVVWQLSIGSMRELQRGAATATALLKVNRNCGECARMHRRITLVNIGHHMAASSMHFWNSRQVM